MKCIKCNKNIPDVSTTCPFCNHPVGVYISEEEKIKEREETLATVDFGNLNASDYDANNKLDIKTYIKEPKNKKVVIGGIAAIILVICIFGVLIMSMFSSGNDSPYRLFNDTMMEFFDFYIENYTGSSSAKSGTYKLDININNKKTGLTGTYSFDTKNRVANLTGKMRDPREQNGGIILDYHDFNFIANLNSTNFYFQSKELFNDDVIYFPIDDMTGLLSSKSYDLSSILTGIEEALTEALKMSTYTNSTEDITYLGEQIKVNCRTLTLDNNGKKQFLKTYYQTLMEDTNYINEITRLKESKNEDVLKDLENKLTEIDYKYSGESNDKIILKIYYSGNKIYRLGVEIHEENKPDYLLQLDVGETKYYLDVFEDNKNILSATLVVTTKEKDDLIKKNYVITFDMDNFVMDMTLDIEREKRADVRKVSYETSKNIRSFIREDYQNLKNNLSVYTSNVDWVDKIPEIFKNKCSPSLICRCEDGEDLCNCTYNDSIIKCPKVEVTPR